MAEMLKFRFHMTTWSPADGHRERRVRMTGTDMQDALDRVTQILKAREPGVIINTKYFEKIGN